MRFLLLVTTHFPAYHQSFLETCWPPATRKSVLLQQADVMVFATGAVSDQNRAAVATAFDACKSTRVVAVPNPGKGKGAMLPLQMAEREGWFDDYDWVIRLNPDVIIRSDAHLLPLFARSDVDAVFATESPVALRAWRPLCGYESIRISRRGALKKFKREPSPSTRRSPRPTAAWAAAGTRARYAIRSARRLVHSNPS